jgi:hypothetical protein
VIQGLLFLESVVCVASCEVGGRLKSRLFQERIMWFKTVGFEVFTAVSMKIAVFWVVAPCSLVEVYQRFRGPRCLHHQGDEIALMMEAARTSETLVNFYQTTRCYNPEDSNLQILYCINIHDEKLIPFIRNLETSSVFCNTYRCEQLSAQALIKNVRSRTMMRLTDEHLEGCMQISTRWIKPDTERPASLPPEVDPNKQM